jgi:parvulin-like peptidyl-prolyl isomerase
MNQPQALIIHQQPISLQQILRQFRRAGQLNNLLTEILSHYVLEQELCQADFSVEDAVFEEAMLEYRKQHHLTDDESFQEWLLDNGLDLATFREQINFMLKINAFKAELAKPKLLETFMEQKLYLDQAVLSHIRVKNRELADELKLQLEEGEKFETFVQEYSCSDDAIVNGVMGILSRSEIQTVFGIDVYQAKVGDLLGPVQCEDGWHILRVDRLLPATLNESVIPLLEEQIFERWLSNQIRALDVEVYLSDQYANVP